MKSIWTWIVGEVQTVEGILSNFTNTVKQLEAHAAEKVREVFHYDAVIADAKEAQQIAQDEAVKARAAAAAISALVTPTASA